jgi:hypothetical protein
MGDTTLADYSIEARSLRVAGIGSHDFWVMRDDSGRIIAELHGLATSRETGHPVPIGTDACRFSLQVWHYAHDAEYARAQGVAPTAMSYVRDDQHSRVVLQAPREEVFARWQSAVDAAAPLNRLDLDYPAYGVKLFGPTINSNSTYRTLGEVMGVDVQPFPGVAEPGVRNRMVDRESIERLQTHGYPTLSEPSNRVGTTYHRRASLDTPDRPGPLEGGATREAQWPIGAPEPDPRNPYTWNARHADGPPSLYQLAHTALNPSLRSKGFDEEAVDRICTGLVARHQGQGLHEWPSDFHVSKDGQRLALCYGDGPFTETSLAGLMTTQGPGMTDTHTDHPKAIAALEAADETRQATVRI